MMHETVQVGWRRLIGGGKAGKWVAWDEGDQA